MPSIDNIFAKYGLELAIFCDGGDLDHNLYEELFGYFYYVTQEMPYGVAKARDNDPYTWVMDRLVAILDDRAKRLDIAPSDAKI